MKRLTFVSDYMEGAHESILKKLAETNLLQTAGYGLDEFSESAREKIRKACSCPAAEIYFLTGGTQTNATVIDAMLKPYQGVVAAESGHISVHEAGAIEAGSHKVMTIPHELGKITAEAVEELLLNFENDANHDHMVMPGMVYISQPTEYGTLYTLEELRKLSSVCRSRGVSLYADGARLAYALASPHNDVSLADLAELCDAFYIGGTKCGALFGEAVVFPVPGTVPHFFTLIKQHGALLAKGRILGIQFDALFTDGLYERIGRRAVELAQRVQQELAKRGCRLLFESPTNQVFAVLADDVRAALEEEVETGFWEKYDASHTVVRFATSWATEESSVALLIDKLPQRF